MSHSSSMRLVLFWRPRRVHHRDLSQQRPASTPAGSALAAPWWSVGVARGCHAAVAPLLAVGQARRGNGRRW